MYYTCTHQPHHRGSDANGTLAHVHTNTTESEVNEKMPFPIRLLIITAKNDNGIDIDI